MRKKLTYVDIIVFFVFFIAEIPFFIISGSIALVFDGYNGETRTAWEIIPNLYIVCVDFVIHLIFYLFFRCVIKKRVHAPIIVAQLAISVIVLPMVVSDFFSAPIILATLAIWIGSCLWFQAIMFGVFTATICIFDRFTGLKEWLTTLMSFFSAILLGSSFSWILLVLLKTAFFNLHNHHLS